jgi:putative FmdB family regulatory protein
MPTYEFRCEKCNNKFTLILSVSEYEKTKFRCPKCKSTRVKAGDHTISSENIQEKLMP